MKKLNIIVFIVVINVFSIVSQTVLKLELLEGSTTHIDGNAGFIKFRFEQNATNFLTKKHLLNIVNQQNKVYFNLNKIAIPVNSYDSSNKMALRDFMKMMEPERYKTLDCNLNYIELPSQNNSKHSGYAVIDIKIKGVTKKYQLPINHTKNGDIYTFTISKKINIRDFNLEAPSAMLGMIKTSNTIEIFLQLVLRITPV